jgi:hypothetical protein
MGTVDPVHVCLLPLLLLPLLLLLLLLPLLLCLQSILQGVDAPLVPNTAVAKLLGASDKAGRKLLQGGRGSGGGGSRGRGDRNNIWAAQNTQAAIKAASSGRTPARYAAAAGSRNARNAGARCVNCVNWR